VSTKDWGLQRGLVLKGSGIDSQWNLFQERLCFIPRAFERRFQWRFITACIVLSLILVMTTPVDFGVVIVVVVAHDEYDKVGKFMRCAAVSDGCALKFNSRVMVATFQKMSRQKT
jgi:hypothetical protein